jgi:hypothetical protein
MNIEITTEVCASLYYWKLNHNYSKIPCFVENEIKTTNKICSISKVEYVVFYTKYVQLLSLFPKLCV